MDVLNEIIFKDLVWVEDWGGYNIVINQCNDRLLGNNVKVFIQADDSPFWCEVPSIPTVSADGYCYGLTDSLRIYYLGNGTVQPPVIKIVY